MSRWLGYRCSVCDREYGRTDVAYTCPADGGNLDIILDLKAIAAETNPRDLAASTEPSIWRYLPLLPVDDPGHGGTPFRSVGWTPMFRPARLASKLGLRNLWLKDDGRNPTASFKDRASAVAVARAEELHATVIVTASTGNAGAALAGMAAAAGRRAVILAPRSAPAAKVAQLLMFGARVFLVNGSYDDAFDLTLEAAGEFSWYCRNTGYNPFTAEGKKTAAFEICEQLGGAQGAKGLWKAPEAIFVSVGDGNIITGLHKGLKDLIALGWIDSMPRLYGVQAQGSAAIADAFRRRSLDVEPVRADTLADSIAVDMPRDGRRAVRAAMETRGGYIVVSDAEILSAMRDLAREAAVFAEPAGAAAYAGLVKAAADGLIDAGAEIVVLNTGNGLKDVRAAMQAAGEAVVIDPTLPALRRALEPEGIP